MRSISAIRPATMPLPGATTTDVTPSCRAGMMKVFAGFRPFQASKDALIPVRAACAAVVVAAGELRVARLAQSERGRGIDEAGGHPLAARVDAARVGGDRDVGADGDDLAIADEHGAVLDPRTADGMHGAPDDGDRLRARGGGGEGEREDPQVRAHQRIPPAFGT
jgi:hypothetical protein